MLEFGFVGGGSHYAKSLNAGKQNWTYVVSPLLVICRYPVLGGASSKEEFSRMISCRRLTLLAAIAALALPAAASAGPLVASAPNCDAQSSSQAFLPWADPASYVLAPGGAAESSDGWTLTGGAAIVAGNEPARVHAAGDSSALALAPGATATTATMCVGIQHPDLRFFAHSTLGGRVSVVTIFETASGDVASAPVGTALAGPWAPTTVMPLAVSLLALLPGSYTPVQFRFTSTGSAPISIDDVYVDPYGSR
jgi:hypothetical protein